MVVKRLAAKVAVARQLNSDPIAMFILLQSLSDHTYL